MAAYVLSEGFETNSPGVVYAVQAEVSYAVVTITDPFVSSDLAFVRVSKAYERIMDYLQANGFKEKGCKDVLPCFEHIYK